MGKILIAGLVVVLFMALSIGGVKAAELEITPKEGELWVTINGELKMVNMTAVAGAWEEHALELEDGELCLLIGEKVAELESLIGRELTLTGVLKPRMRCRGKLTRTIEIRSIDKIGGYVAKEPKTKVIVPLAWKRVSGRLSIERMTNFPDNPWTEVFLTTDEDEVYIVRGELTSKELREQVGKYATVTGDPQPEIKDRTGTYRPVIWVREINRIRELPQKEE